MANLASIYSNATGKTKLTSEEDKEKFFSAAESASRQQLHQSWLLSTITQEMFLKLHSQIKELNEANAILALGSALKDPTLDREKQIVHNLIRINTLAEMLKTHAR